ncbi:MAG: HD domain-containing protein, partial [Desulfobacteraceae bacterium]|nr:HD domain-containing protein [Desulfobacteraceae bacterium]
MAQKLFRDPLYDYIAIDRDSWILQLINCPEVQRLRYINQLGLCNFTYPGSTHSRFSHSLGVLHLMQQCISHLKQEYSEQFKPRQLNEEALQAAALLHDIGHSPLSHATEGIFGDHVERAVEIILNPDSQVHEILAKRASSLPVKVAALIAKSTLKDIPQAPLWQKSLISSQLDMDRLDYLRRDALNSGAEYGNFDWFRIIRTMHLKEKVIKGKQKGIFIVWPDKSKFAIEEYIFSRFYMYQSVYFHHTTRGFEGLLQRILRYAKDLAKKNKSFAQGLILPMKILIGGKQSQDPARFQNLTDHILLAQITIWQNHKDKILSDLVQRLMKRRGIGWEEVSEKSGFEMTNKVNAVRNYLQEKGLNHEHYFFQDVTKAKVYEPYRPAAEVEDQSSVNSIMLYDSSWQPTGFREISDVPDLERLRAITMGKLSQSC